MEPFFVAGKPISVNRAYGNAHGHVYLTKAARLWRDSVYYATLHWHRDLNPPQVFVYPKVRYRFIGCKSDADNLLKLTQDGLKMALGRDDRFFSIASATVERKGPQGVQGVWITIEEGYQDASDEAQATQATA